MSSDTLGLVDRDIIQLKGHILDVFTEDLPIKPSKVRALEKLGRALDDYLEG